ncbi:MAG: hypothetical protein K2H43_05990 [Clostridia bacterium]|nr:hypothetical protein [Clostridia bacterium]
MEWLNEGAGLIALISVILSTSLLIVVICILWGLRNRIAVQRLNFLGFYSTDVDTRENYTELTVGNRSLNEVALVELGIRNGRVNFDLTSLYRKKSGLSEDVRIVVEQRSSIRFTLTEEELRRVLIDGKKGKVLKKLRLYAVDLTGNLYKGKIPAVRKLLQQSVSGKPAVNIRPSVSVSEKTEKPEVTETAEEKEKIDV